MSEVSTHFAFLFKYPGWGAASARELYQAVRRGQSPLAEAHDRVSIQMRKKSLDTGVSFFKRGGLRHLK